MVMKVIAFCDLVYCFFWLAIFRLLVFRHASGDWILLLLVLLLFQSISFLSVRLLLAISVFCCGVVAGLFLIGMRKLLSSDSGV